MADPIRPSSWPNLPAAPARGGGTGDARSAAQRAFFEQALGRTAAPPTTALTTVVAETSTPVNERRAPDLHIKMPDAPPTKILRPGSLLDIKV